MRPPRNPTWAIVVNGSPFHRLTPKQSAIVAEGEQIWGDFTKTLKDIPPPWADIEWGEVERRANDGEPGGLEELAKCGGSKEVFRKMREMGENGKRAQFHLAHQGFLATTKQAAREIREVVLKFRDDYVLMLSSTRARLGLAHLEDHDKRRVDLGSCRHVPWSDEVTQILAELIRGLDAWVDHEEPGRFTRPTDHFHHLREVSDHE